MLPVLAWAMARVGRLLERRNGGESTAVSRLLLRSSSALARLTKGRESSDHGDRDAVTAPAKTG